jgi:hypothetical protein
MGWATIRRRWSGWRKAWTLSDSIKATENAASLQNLLVKYETEKKEEELRRITTETELKDLLIQKRNIQLMGGGVGGVDADGVGVPDVPQL